MSAALLIGLIADESARPNPLAIPILVVVFVVAAVVWFFTRSTVPPGTTIDSTSDRGARVGTVAGSTAGGNIHVGDQITYQPPVAPAPSPDGRRELAKRGLIALINQGDGMVNAFSLPTYGELRLWKRTADGFITTAFGDAEATIFKEEPTAANYGEIARIITTRLRELLKRVSSIPIEGDETALRHAVDRVELAPAVRAEVAMAISDVLYELKANEKRIREAAKDGRYRFDFFLASDQWHRHNETFPRHGISQIRDEGKDFYLPAEELNRAVQQRESNGSEVLPEDDLDGLMAALRKVTATLARLTLRAGNHL